MSEQIEDQAKQDEPVKTTRGRQAKQEDQAKQDNSHLIVMTKDGAAIKVHPSCVADHQRLGWVAQ